jgi:hypothetical protein
LFAINMAAAAICHARLLIGAVAGL